MDQQTNFFSDPVYYKGEKANPFLSFQKSIPEQKTSWLLKKEPVINHLEEFDQLKMAIESHESSSPKSVSKKNSSSSLEAEKQMIKRMSIELQSELNEFFDQEKSSMRLSTPFSNSQLVSDSSILFENEPLTSRQIFIKRVRKLQGEENSKVMGDDRRNMYGNSAKAAIRAYDSRKYSKKINRLHHRLGIQESRKAVRFYTDQLNSTISLGCLYDLLNYDEGSQEEKLYKKAFLAFYRWYMKEVYPGHILAEGKILNKSLYLEEKSILVYLPDLTVRAQKKVKAAKKGISATQMEDQSLSNKRITFKTCDGY